MSKFLKLVEENRPLTSQELDKVTPVKRIIQRALLSDASKPMLDEIGLQKVIVTEDNNNIILKFNDGTILTYTAEITKEEESEDVIRNAATKESERNPKGPVATKLTALNNEEERLRPGLPKALDTRIELTRRANDAIKKGGF